MRWYKCNKCGDTFDEDEIVTKYIHYTGYNLPDGGYYEQECYCPHCESVDYYEVYECADCEELFDEEELHEGRCENCLKEWVFDKNDIKEVWAYIKLELDDFAQYVKEVENERAKERRRKENGIKRNESENHIIRADARNSIK